MPRSCGETHIIIRAFRLTRQAQDRVTQFDQASGGWVQNLILNPLPRFRLPG